MARIRYIKPEFFEDERLGDLSLMARYLYLGLFCHLDRTGVAPYSNRIFKAKVFPFDDQISATDVENAVNALVQAGRLQRFRWNEQEYVYCKTFTKHQLFHKNERSKFPLSQEEIEALCKHSASTVQAPEQHTKELVTGNGELVTGNGQRGIELPEIDSKPKRKAKKPKASPEALSARERLKEYWIKIYQAAFKHEYVGTDSAFFNTQIKRLHERFGAEKAAELMKLYIAFQDPFIVRKGHPLELLLPNVISIEAHRHREGELFASVARGNARQKVLTEAEQRLEEMKIHGERSRSKHAIGSGDSQSSCLTFSERTEDGISSEFSEPHGIHAAVDAEAS
jgi:hypothetical protein